MGYLNNKENFNKVFERNLLKTLSYEIRIGEDTRYIRYKKNSQIKITEDGVKLIFYLENEDNYKDKRLVFILDEESILYLKERNVDYIVLPKCKKIAVFIKLTYDFFKYFSNIEYLNELRFTHSTNHYDSFEIIIQLFENRKEFDQCCCYGFEVEKPALEGMNIKKHEIQKIYPFLKKFLKSLSFNNEITIKDFEFVINNDFLEEIEFDNHVITKKLYLKNILKITGDFNKIKLKEVILINTIELDIDFKKYNFTDKESKDFYFYLDENFVKKKISLTNSKNLSSIFDNISKIANKNKLNYLKIKYNIENLINFSFFIKAYYQSFFKLDKNKIIVMLELPESLKHESLIDYFSNNISYTKLNSFSMIYKINEYLKNNNIYQLTLYLIDNYDKLNGKIFNITPREFYKLLETYFFNPVFSNENKELKILAKRSLLKMNKFVNFI